MSNLAVIDVEADDVPAGSKVVALVNGFGRDDHAGEASFAALLHELSTLEPDVRRSDARTLPAADAVVVTNPTFTSNVPDLMRAARLTMRARLHGKAVALVGVSAHRMSSPLARALARSVINNSDLVLLRDEASADVLAGIGVEPPFRMGADPAWAQLDDLFAAREVEDRVVVALDAPIDLRDASRMETSLVGALSPLAATGLNVTLQPMGNPRVRNSSVDFVRRVAGKLSGDTVVLDPPATLREARDVYAGSRVVLAHSRHAVMAASSAGSRTVAFTTDPSVERLSDALAVPTLSTDGSSLLLRDALLMAADGEASADSAAVRALIDRARGSIELVRLLLTHGAASTATATDPLPLYPTPWRS